MDAPRPRPHRRAKSISNAVLSRRKLRRHVTFTAMAPSVLEGGVLSRCDSDAKPGGGKSDGGKSDSPGSPAATQAPARNCMPLLSRVRLHPHSQTMGNGSLLDTVLSSHNSSVLQLPEFNKRPLTDTPIVLGMASPVTRYLLDDEPEEHPGRRAPKNISHLSLADLNAVAAGLAAVRSDFSSLPATADATAGEDAPASSGGSGGGTVSPGTVSPGSAGTVSPGGAGSETPSPTHTGTATPTVTLSGVASPVSPSSPTQAELLSRLDRFELGHEPGHKRTSLAEKPKLAPAQAKAHRQDVPPALSQIKEDLIQEVPPELQQQFQKTPLFEKLKDMLLLRPFARQQKAYTLNIAGQTSLKISPDGRIASVDVGSKLVIVMVGLPARGKSYITNKLTRYLNWLQHDCRVFNVGNTRRMDKHNVLGPASRPLPDTSTPLPHTGLSPALGSESPMQKKLEPEHTTSHSANFFNPENKELTEIREKWAMDTLDTLLNWVIDGPGSVGILDATNSTKKRRLKVFKRIQERTNGELKVLFLESICADPAILDTNIRLKLSGPDYHDMDPELAFKDFMGRLKNYESAYEPIDEQEEQIPGFQYVKMIDVGKKVVSYNILGFLASQTIYFLLNFNLCERQIWLTRHGESVDNLSGRIGGDSPLTKRGQLFAKTLTRFVNYQRREFRRKQLESFSSRLELRYNELVDNGKSHESQYIQIPTEPSFCVWTSMLMRAVETGKYFDEQEYNVKAMRMLNELGGGKFEGMTYDEIRRKQPKEFEGRIRNKLTYRYPGVGGESYLDVMVRLRPLINEIERTTDHLLIVSHRVVLRVLLAYFLNLEKSAIVDLDVPLHTLYVLELKPYGTEYAMYEYDKAADWFKKVEPEHQKNVREVGVNFRERKYSVVPTAPPTAHRSSTAAAARSSRSSLKRSDSLGKDLMLNFSVRRSLAAAEQDLAETRGALANLLSSRKLADLNKMRKP